jgi:hypothetical protein
VLLHGIRAAVNLGAWCLFIRGDSELVINQVMKELACHNVRMEAYCTEVWKLEDKFHGIKLHHILRWDNEEADALARLASSRKPLPPRIFLDILDTPSICLKGVKAPTLASGCNTPGVCPSLSSGSELKPDRLSGDDDVKVNLWK